MFKFMLNALPTYFSQITLNLILTFICITLVSAVICILIPLRLLRDLNPSVIMDRVYGTVCHMKLNLKKKLFLHSQGNLNAMLTSSVICLILLFSLFCFMYIATHITIVLKLLLCWVNIKVEVKVEVDSLKGGPLFCSY